MTYFVLVMFFYSQSAVVMPSRYKTMDKCNEAAAVAKKNRVKDGISFSCFEIMYPP